MRSVTRLSVVLVVLAAWCGDARAGLRLPAIVGDNMVLQQEANAPVWGWADPGQKVTVTLGGHRATATADDKGKWIAHLGSLKAGGPYEVAIQAGNQTITLHNVKVGEVWLCSGQSNMQANLGWLGGRQAVAEANEPEIHLFIVRIWLSPQPMDDTQGQWVVCSPKTVLPFSAVGYYFGRHLQHELRVPVGLIDSSSGGSTAQTWISEEAFRGHEKLVLCRR